MNEPPMPRPSSNGALMAKYAILIACAPDLETIAGLAESWTTDDRLALAEKDALERWSNGRERALRSGGVEA